MPAVVTRTVRQRWVDTQLTRLEARLVRERDEIPPTVVHEWVQRAGARLAGSRVLDFVPILVERAVQAQVRATAGRFTPGNDSGAASPVMTVQGEPLPVWAQRTAQRYLATELPRRWAHTQGVAHRAEQVAQALPAPDRPVLLAAAWLHDIGYAHELADTGWHPLDGARFLRQQNVPPRVCALVAHHSGAAAVADLLGLAGQLALFPDEHTPVRDALWYCDMTTDPDGRPITPHDRISEIRTRREPGDPVVRALNTNINDRFAAVQHTHRLLHRMTA